MTWLDRPRIARRLLLWAMTACLAIGLPLQSLSAAVAGAAGLRHGHRPAAPDAPPGDPMAGWKDFRRANYEWSAPEASARPHARAHELGLRHHHDPHDASVVDVETLPDEDAAPSAATAAGAHFAAMAASGPAPHAAPAEPGAGAWRTAPAASFDSQHPRRIERPPQARG